MNENFNYKSALTNIKASLFDIYEDQEIVIGSLSSEDRSRRVSEFIEIKDLAIVLLDKIQKLYDNSDTYQDVNLESTESSNDSSSEASSLIDDKQKAEDVPDDIHESNDLEGTTDSDTEIDNVDYSSSDLEEDSDQESVDNNSKDDDNEVDENKYYLLCDEEKLHFAYASQRLLEKIRNYHLEDESKTIDAVDTSNDNSVYKIDNLPVKGIIVRNDQYMKLALSKHRQEGVLKEARAYRIEVVKRKRQEQQKIELEKAKVHLDI